MSLATRRLSNSFLEFNPDQEFQLPKGAKTATGKAIFVLDTKTKILSVLNDNSTPLKPEQTTDLLTITKWVKEHLPSEKELHNHSRDPKLLFFAGKRIDQLNVLVDRHNKHVDRSVWIEFVHVVLLILTLGFFKYRDTLRIEEVARPDIANYLHGHKAREQQEACAAAITLYDLLESKKPEEVLKDVGMSAAWKQLTERLDKGKEFSLLEALRAVRKEEPALDALFLTSLPNWIDNNRSLPYLQALLLPKEELEQLKLADLGKHKKDSWDVLAIRMSRSPKPANFKEPNSLENCPLAHIKHLKTETLYTLLKNRNEMPPLCFLSEEQIQGLPFAELSGEKIKALLNVDFPHEEVICLLSSAQLAVIFEKDQDFFLTLLPYLSIEQLADQPKEVRVNINVFLNHLLKNNSFSEEEKRERVALVQERLLAHKGQSPSKIQVGYIPLLNLSKEPFTVLQKLGFTTKEGFARLSLEQVGELLSWIETNQPADVKVVGYLLSEAHWKGLKKEQFTKATLPFLLANDASLAHLSSEIQNHIKSLRNIT